MAFKSGDHSKDHLHDKPDDDKKTFNPFKAIRRMFRDGRKAGNKKHDRSTENVTEGNLDKRVSMSHDSIFAADVTMPSLAATSRSSPKPISAKVAIPKPSRTRTLLSPQEELHFRFSKSLEVDQPDEGILSTSAPAFLSSGKKIGSKFDDDLDNEKFRTSSYHTIEEPSSGMDSSYAVESKLNNSAAYDKIAARPRNRKAKRKKPTFAENSTSNIFDIVSEDAISPSIDQFNQEPSHQQTELDIGSPNHSTARENFEKIDVLTVEPTKREVSVKKASSFRATLGGDIETTEKAVTVKKSRSFKSPLGVGNALIPSLNEMQKIKLRKTTKSVHEASSSQSHNKKVEDSLFTSNHSVDNVAHLKRIKSPTRPHSMFEQPKSMLSPNKGADQQSTVDKTETVFSPSNKVDHLSELKRKKPGFLSIHENQTSDESTSHANQTTGSASSISINKAHSLKESSTSKGENSDHSVDHIDYRAVLGKRVLSEGDSPVKTIDLPKQTGAIDFKANLNVTSPHPVSVKHGEDVANAFQVKLRKVSVEDDMLKRDNDISNEVKINTAVKSVIKNTDDDESSKKAFDTNKQPLKKSSDEDGNSSSINTTEKSFDNILKKLKKVNRNPSDKKSKKESATATEDKIEATALSVSSKGTSSKTSKKDNIKVDPTVMQSFEKKKIKSNDESMQTISAANPSSSQALKKSGDVKEMQPKDRNVIKSDKTDRKPGFAQLRSTGIDLKKTQNKNNNNSLHANEEQKSMTIHYAGSPEDDVPETFSIAKTSDCSISESPKNPTISKPKTKKSSNNMDEDKSSSIQQNKLIVDTSDTSKNLVSSVSVKNNDGVLETDNNQTGSDPLWVSLARKRSKRWNKSLTPSNAVDIDLDQKKDSSVTNDFKPTDKNEKRIESNNLPPSHIVENTSLTSEEKPIQRSFSHNTQLHSDDSSEKNQTNIPKKPLQQSLSSNVPSWMEIAMKKQKRWSCEEPA